MYGDGNSAKLMKDIMGTVTQVTDGLKESTGVDLQAVLAGFLGGKIAMPNNAEGYAAVTEEKADTYTDNTIE